MKSLKLLSLTLIAAVLFFNSCKEKNEDLTTDYLTFGAFYGFCPADCNFIYKIQDGQLFETNVDRGVPQEITFFETPMSDDDFNTAQVLLNGFPQTLLDTEKATYGCPDCADQGGFILEQKKGDEVRRWLIDTSDTEDQNEDLLKYKNQINEIISFLQQ